MSFDRARVGWTPYALWSRILKPCCRCGAEDERGGRWGWHWRVASTGARGGTGTEAICSPCLIRERAALRAPAPSGDGGRTTPDAARPNLPGGQISRGQG